LLHHHHHHQTTEGEEGLPPIARDESKRLQCRFYEELYPNPESMVMVKVMNIADMAAEVILLEYNDIEVRVEGREGGRTARLEDKVQQTKSRKRKGLIDGLMWVVLGALLITHPSLPHPTPPLKNHRA